MNPVIPFQLTVRGTTRATSLDARRALHNETAGSPAGIAAARAMSDLSHEVYVPCADAGAQGGTRPEELLFLDVWTDPRGLEQFFANHDVIASANRLFTERDGTLWQPAAGALTVQLAVPAHATRQYLGVIRVEVKSHQEALDVFAEANGSRLARARAGGLCSHRLFFRFTGPSGPGTELLGLDVWTDLKGMMAHYGETMGPLAKVFAGTPATSVWERASGFTEW